MTSQHSGKVCRHTPVTYYNIIIAQPPQPWFKHLFHLALCHQSSRHSCRSCAGKLLEQETKTNAWKIRKLGSNKILEKTACCNHILSGRKSRGMSHLNQTSESLWATINSNVSSRNSTHKRFLGSFLLQSLLNKSTLTPWNEHLPWMLLANIANTVFNWIAILYILLGHEVDHVVFTEWTRWTLFAQFDSGSRSKSMQINANTCWQWTIQADYNFSHQVDTHQSPSCSNMQSKV